MTALVIRGDARQLPLADATVDLIVTSPPYFGLRSYEDDGNHYDGQIGSEPTPHAWLEQMLACTAEWIRVLKPTGSIWVNLGDKYSDRAGPSWVGSSDRLTGRPPKPRRPSSTTMAPRKSLLGLPWRYAIGCIDELGLILREEVIWSKPNAMPESVSDRCRRSHEQWFHFTLQGSYYAAMDELREPHNGGGKGMTWEERKATPGAAKSGGRENSDRGQMTGGGFAGNSLGRPLGSVWEVPSEPLNVPAHLGVDHFAAFPTELPRRIIAGWSPPGICTACGQGRRPVVAIDQIPNGKTNSGRAKRQRADQLGHDRGFNAAGYPHTTAVRTIVCWECACPAGVDAPTRPAIVLDPFSGTGTSALVASALGRIGIGVDRSHDYCRIGVWRTNDPAQRAKVRRERPPVEQTEGQSALWE